MILFNKVEFSDIYKHIAEAISEGYLFPEKMQDSLDYSLQLIIDLNSSTFSTTAGIEINILYPIYEAYLRKKEYADSLISTVMAVKAMNDYVIRNYTGTLSEFVNDINWANEYVPIGWVELSQQGGTDISEWSTSL